VQQQCARSTQHFIEQASGVGDTRAAQAETQPSIITKKTLITLNLEIGLRLIISLLDHRACDQCPTAFRLRPEDKSISDSQQT
jgi:hypothetical protein